MINRRLNRAIATAGWISAAIVMLLPLLWMWINSLKGSNIDVFRHPFQLPGRWVFSNYSRALREGALGNAFINSLWVTGLSVGMTIVFGAWAGYALSKRRFPGRRTWTALLVFAMVLPVQSVLIPSIDLLISLRIYDSLWALILPYTAQSLPISILLFAAFFRELPVEIEEAARLDGVGTFRFYWQILFPVASPMVATVAVLACINSWTEFLMATLFIVDPAMKTLPVSMIAFEQAHNTDFPALLAGLSLIVLPALAAYLVFNRQVIRGVMAGAVK